MRARALSVAGVAIIALSAGAAVLPAGKTISSDMIGGLLVAGGLIETVAGSLRREARPFAMAAGIVTALAGVLFIVDPETHFFPRVVPIIGWLLLRSLILLGVLLIAGLSISTIVISVFGPTQELVATFSWILAASFVVNGLMLLEVASCEREASA
jgi:hypothetical protein